MTTPAETIPRPTQAAAVSRSNEAKISMLDIDPKVIETYGAVSQQTAEQMARGAIRQSGTTWAVAVTGIAGPGGGTDEKPVGTVWIAWAERENPHVVAKCQRFLGDRTAVRRQTVLYALDGLIAALSRP